MHQASIYRGWIFLHIYGTAIMKLHGLLDEVKQGWIFLYIYGTASTNLHEHIDEVKLG